MEPDISVQRHREVYVVGLSRGRPMQWRPYAEGGELHVFDQVETVGNISRSLLQSSIEQIAPHIVRVTVAGWRLGRRHSVYSQFYFVREEGGWVARRATHHSIRGLGPFQLQVTTSTTGATNDD